MRCLERIVAGGAPGVIAEVRSGSKVWRGAAGLADLETRRPRNVDEHFRIGSVTKTFTATVLLQLVAEGLVDLESCRPLLSHTSGIFDYGNDPGFMADLSTNRFRTYRPAELVAMARAHPPTSTDYHYSNTNYVLLGQLIEETTGHSYAEEVRRRIIQPLGLTGTYLPGTDTTLPEPHARHYSPLLGPGSKPQDVTELNPSYAWAVGDLVSTLGDLTTFFGALLAGRLLPPDVQQQMVTLGFYGLGLVHWRLPDDTDVWGHNGMIFGGITLVAGTRGGERVVAVNVNSDERDYPVEAFAPLWG